MCVPEILADARVAAQNWNTAIKYGPHCELIFFLMKHEPADGGVAGELAVWSVSLLATMESRGTGPLSGSRRPLCSRGAELQAGIQGRTRPGVASAPQGC